MQAIQTKFFGWNAARQAYRIKATAPVGSIWHSFGQLQGDIEPEHEKAARALVDRFGWNMDIVGGTLADSSMVWVLVPKPEPERIEWTRIKNDISDVFHSILTIDVEGA